MRLSGPICSTCSAPPARPVRCAAAGRSASGPPSSASWTRWSAHPGSCSTGAWISWPPTSSGWRCSRRSMPTRESPPNNARFVFLDLQATEFFGEWDKVANDTVALLRAEAGRNRYDRQLSDLIEELSTRSEEFRVRWAAHHVRIHTTGTKLPPPGRRRPGAGVRVLPAGRRPQPEPPHLHRRTRIALPGRPPPAGQLGRDHPRHRTACGYRRPRAG